MPVARLTNIANFADLLQEIRDFINDTGDWTIHEDMRSPTEGAAAGGAELIVSNGDVLAGLRSTTSGAGANRLYLFDGVPPYSSADLDLLNGNSGVRVSDAGYTSSSTPAAKVTQPQFAGPFPTAYLFTDNPSTYCHVVVEVIAGRFRHILFGNAIKFGVWTGGGYYGVTRWDTSTLYTDVPGSEEHSTPFDGATNASDGGLHTLHYVAGSSNWNTPTGADLNSVVRRTGRGSARGGFGTMFRSVQETPWSGLIALQPVTMWAVNASDSPATVRCVAQIPDIAEVNMRNLEPGESYFIGADEWIVFPHVLKRDPSDRSDTEHSGYYGMAYKVIP